MYKLVAAILLGKGVGGRMATAPHYKSNIESLTQATHKLNPLEPEFYI